MRTIEFYHAREKETIIHNECACLECYEPTHPNCLKRRYNLYDYTTDTYIEFYVCNELVRLKYHNRKLNPRYDDCYYGKRYEDVVKDIIKEYIKLTGRGGYHDGDNRNDLLDRRVWINVCDRPFLGANLTLKEACLLYMETKSKIILNRIRVVLSEYMSGHIYKKYKTRYNNVLMKIRRLERHNWLNQEETINEILMDLLKLQIKNK